MRTFTVERDATPPQVWVSAPAGIIGGAFTVTWGAVDAQAGVAWYDLDVSVDGGPWERVLTQTPITNYQHTNPPNTHVTFRVTATDHVSNAASAVARTSVVRVTKYYYHGGARVALRTTGAGGSVVYWLHSDHLGSVSLVTDHASRVVAQQRFLPYGGVRYSEGTFPTDVGFTGHRGHPALGLVYMRARYYHVALGRFVSADTVVPEPGNPQSLNRFSYVLGNPLRYTDPTGHCAAGDYECTKKLVEVALRMGYRGRIGDWDLAQWDLARLDNLLSWLDRGVVFMGLPNWQADRISTVLQALNAVQTSLGNKTDAALGLDHGTLMFRVDRLDPGTGAQVTVGVNEIVVNSMHAGTLQVVDYLHEIGHIVDWHISNETGLWSDKNFIPGQYTRDRLLGFLWGVGERKYRGERPGEFAPHSTANPVEDFADTFSWRVMTDAGIALPGGWNDPASPGRQNDLNRGLDSLTVQANP